MVAKEEMAAFGYEPEPLRLPPRERLRFALDSVPLETARLLVWRTREAIRDRRGRPLPAYRLVDTDRVA
jgi:hypothetical protein